MHILLQIVCFFQEIYLAPLTRIPKYSAVDWETSAYSVRDQDGPGTYAFGYDVEDADTNNLQTRSEERFTNGTVVGNYGYLQPDGLIHMVNYIADEKGFR